MKLLILCQTGQFDCFRSMAEISLSGGFDHQLIYFLGGLHCWNIIIGLFAALEGCLATRRRNNNLPSFWLTSRKSSQISIPFSLPHYVWFRTSNTSKWRCKRLNLFYTWRRKDIIFVFFNFIKRSKEKRMKI